MGCCDPSRGKNNKYEGGDQLKEFSLLMNLKLEKEKLEKEQLELERRLSEYDKRILDQLIEEI